MEGGTPHSHSIVSSVSKCLFHMAFHGLELLFTAETTDDFFRLASIVGD